MGGLTPSQTVGPFFHEALLRDQALHIVARPGTDGRRVVIEGRVVDGEGAGVDDGLVEVWQADARGDYRRPSATRADVDASTEAAFRGFGRSGTDDTGAFRFETVKPGPVAHPDGGQQAPHVLVFVFATGLLDHLVTRMYFSDEPANDTDPVLCQVPADRRATLVATKEDGGTTAAPQEGRDGDTPRYRFDIHLQGPDETVFFQL